MPKKAKTEQFNKCILRLLEELENGDRTELQLVVRTTKEGYTAHHLADALTHLKSFGYVTKYKPKKGAEKVMLDRLGRDKLEAMREKEAV